MKSMQMQMDLGTLDKIRRDRSVDEIIAVRLSESPTGEDRLMEMICERENMLKAFKRVASNKGKPGVDGMKTTQLRKYLDRHWDKIKRALMEGSHKPFPVRRVEIPKDGGGIRLLGIPTVLDRLIQQGIGCGNSHVPGGRKEVANVRRDGPGQGHGQHGRGDQALGVLVVEVQGVVITGGGGVVSGPSPVDIGLVRAHPGACELGVQFHDFLFPILVDVKIRLSFSLKRVNKSQSSTGDFVTFGDVRGIWTFET